MEAAWANEASSSSSLSSSSISTQFNYDIFLSFHGVDTRYNFTSHLLDKLKRCGCRTFIDDTELSRGESINDALLKAIGESRISVVVLSKNYAASRWCLDELVKIMECRKTLQQIVLPIFYNVDPSDVRWQKGSLAEAFAKHEERFKDSSDGRMNKWREALTEVANLSGWDLSKVDNGDEASLIRKAVEEVQNKLDIVQLHVACHEIGLESRIQKLKLLLKMESDDVRIVAVWGMGGIGKTTLVKKLYNLIQRKFEGSCFLANIRETSKQPNGLVVLQEQLLSDVLRTRTHKIINVDNGIEVIKRRALSRKVLLILDDVDDVQQLKALAIDRDSFGLGSRIVVTTRDISLLNFLEEYKTYEAEKLNQDESLELFSWHCFKEDHPTKDHLGLSCQVVHYAGGLPLALEILGSSFRGESIPEWKSAIEKLREFPDDKIHDKLKISFDSLNKEEQELFLDLACFFVEKDRDFTVKILAGRDYFPEIGIQVLAKRCLVKYGYHNKIMMHDMVRDMGREIVRQESLEDPGERSRLWHLDDVLEVLRYGTGTEAVKGLLLNTIDVQVNAKPFEKIDKLWYHESVLEVRRDTMGTKEVENCLLNSNDPEHVQVNAKAFEKMNNLWLLHLDYVHQTADFEHASRRLLWLSWKGFPLECLPWNLSMEKLIALDLGYSSLKKVWNGNKILDKLKFLYLSHCHYLTRTPDFSGLNSLEELLLNDCESLVEVDESIRCLNKLLVLDMSNCTKLQKLPSGIWMLKSLEYLYISGCSKLGNLAVFKGPLHKLWCLFFSSWTLPPKGMNSIGFSLTSVHAFSCLKELWMANCSLSYLPDEIGRLISLETFIIRGNCLSTLPDGIGNLSRLKALYVFENKLSHLPSGIGNLMSLDSLVLECESLLTLPDSFCSLTRLEFFQVYRCNLSQLPSEIGNLVSLKQLLLDGGNNIYTLPDSICSLTQLESLKIDGCNLSHLPSEIGNLVSLQFLDLRGNNFCTLPDSIRNVRGLGTLILDNCAKLQSLPKLPACQVSAVGCTSLESIPFELDQLGLSIQCRGCNKLAENNFANSLLKQLHKSKGLAELKEVVDILVPTGGEVPIWFPCQGRGSYTMADVGLPICPDLQRPLFSNVTKESESVLQIGGKLGGVQGPNIPAPPVDLQLSYISFVVPPLVKQKMLGWLICIFLTGLAGFKENDSFFLSMGKVICNKIEKYDRRFETRKVSTCQDQVWLVYTPQGYSGFHLEGGDEVEISIRSTPVAMAKVNWGVDFIYEVDENITKTNENQEPLIQHPSEPYQDVSLPEDFSLANK